MEFSNFLRFSDFPNFQEIRAQQRRNSGNVKFHWKVIRHTNSSIRFEFSASKSFGLQESDPKNIEFLNFPCFSEFPNFQETRFSIFWENEILQRNSCNGAKHSPQSAVFMKWVRPKWRVTNSTKIIEIWYFSLIRFLSCHNLPPSPSQKAKFCQIFSSGFFLWAEKSQSQNRKLHAHESRNSENGKFHWKDILHTNFNIRFEFSTSNSFGLQ